MSFFADFGAPDLVEYIPYHIHFFRCSQTTMSVVAVATSPDHSFSKPTVNTITLIAGLGVEGDAHLGETDQHTPRLRIKPPPKNLRQVHLISIEALQERDLIPGAIGENITIEGLDLLELSVGTRLTFVVSSGDTDGQAPTIVLTGLRNPCSLIEKYRKGLKETFVERNAERKIVRRFAGLMATVEVGGIVTSGMRVVIRAPEEFVPLAPV